jgi:hypothetical protein
LTDSCDEFPSLPSELGNPHRTRVSTFPQRQLLRRIIHRTSKSCEKREVLQILAQNQLFTPQCLAITTPTPLLAIYPRRLSPLAPQGLAAHGVQYHYRWPTTRPECGLGLGCMYPAPLPASRRSTHFKPLGILKSPHATTACGAPSRSSDLNGQGRPPLQGGEGLNVV